MIQKLFLSFVMITSLITSLCRAATGDDRQSFELDTSIRYVRGRFNLETEERTFLTTPTKPTKSRTQAILMYDGSPTPIEETVFREEVLLVSGRDGRRQVTDTESFPWCLHGQMSMEFGGSTYGGSGTLIGPHHFLTAGHCVYKPESGEAATNIRIRLGLNDRAAMFGEVLGTKVYLYNQWMTSRSDDFDIALVVLNQSIGHETGWAGLLCLEDKELKDHAVHVTGYPGDKGFRTLWTMDNRIGRITREKIYYPIDTYGGQSGGAIWIKKWGMPYVVGNHAYGGTLSDGGNFGVRLSETKIRDLVEWIEETFIIDEPRATEPVIRPRVRATIGGGGGSAGAGAGAASGGARGAPPTISPTTMGGSVVGRSGAGGSSLRASAPVAAALPTAPTAARSTAVSPPSVPLTAGAGDGAGAGSSVPRPLGRAIPSVALGFEEEYTRFLNMRLVYKPNKDNDTGLVDIPVSTLIDLGMDPLAGRFDLSSFGDAGKYISIYTGYQKGKILANAEKFEIWLCPKFLAERELGTTARHLAPIMSGWTNPVGYFWTYGMWALLIDDYLDEYDYLLTGDDAMDATQNLYEKWTSRHCIMRSDEGWSQQTAGIPRRLLGKNFYVYELGQLAVLPTAPTAARSSAVSPPSVPLTAVARAGAGAGSVVIPRPLSPAIPDVAIGYEEEYTRFLNMRLVYKPYKDSDTGRVVIPVSKFIDLGVDPLSGTFDLSSFGRAARYISIRTGYRKEMMDANHGKLEIRLCPKFLATQELSTTGRHLAPTMDRWTNPVGYFWRWGGWDNLDWYDYLVTGDVGSDSSKNLYEKCSHARPHPYKRITFCARAEYMLGERGESIMRSVTQKFLFI